MAADLQGEALAPEPPPPQLHPWGFTTLKKNLPIWGGSKQISLKFGGGLITLKKNSCAVRAIVLIIATFKLHFPSKINHMKLTTSIMLI